MKLRVAGAQIPVTLDVAQNAQRLGRAIAWASDQGADILLTPEGSLSGYTSDFDASAVREALAALVEMAARLGVGLALGTCYVEEADGRCYNQVRFYRPDGTYLGFHSKTLTCGSLEAQPKGEINHYAVAPLRLFGWNGIAVGALICNDLWANPPVHPCA